MTCNKSIFNSRKGLSLIHTMICAFFVTLFTIVLAYYLSYIKPGTIVSVTSLISADYNMESAIISQMQKYKDDPKKEPKSFNKEIMLAINMSVECKKISDKEYLFEAKVDGRNIHREIKVKGNTTIPDKLIFLE